MINLYRAELQKIIGNRWVSGLLLWVFPVGAFGVIVFVAIMALFIQDFDSQFFNEPPLWTSTMIGVWNFPTNTLGQMFLIGLTAVTFAGEYQWGTWKNILPRQRRTAVILVKFLALGTLVVFTFLLMSIILGVGYGFITKIAGIEYGPAFSQDVFVEFIKDYGLQAMLAFFTVLITSVYAALAAMLMRSILGGVMVGLGIIIVEPVSSFILIPIATLLERENLLQLIRFTPTYNVDNIRSLVSADVPSQMFTWIFEANNLGNVQNSLGLSLFILTVWVTLGISLILWLFNRQDISS